MVGQGWYGYRTVVSYSLPGNFNEVLISTMTNIRLVVNNNRMYEKNVDQIISF